MSLKIDRIEIGLSIVYAFKIIVGRVPFPDHFKGYKKWDTTWLLAQSQFRALVSLIIARQWVRHQT